MREELLKELGVTICQEQELNPTLSEGRHDDSHESQQSVTSGATIGTNLHHTQQKHQQVSLELTIDPDQYRKIEEGVAGITNGSGRVEVLQMRVAQPSSSSSHAVSNSASSSIAADIALVSQSIEKMTDNQNNQHKTNNVDIPSTTPLNTINEAHATDMKRDDIDESSSEADADGIELEEVDLQTKLRALALNAMTCSDDSDVPLGMVNKSKQVFTHLNSTV